MIQVWGVVSLGGASNHFSPRLLYYCWQHEAPQPVVFWWKEFNCQHPNGQTNYQCKLISWFKRSTAVALPKHRVWLLNWEKVHVLGRYTRDCINKWDWVYGNEINVFLLLGTALWIPMRGKMVSVATTARIYILCVRQASNVDLWHCATCCSADLLSSYRQISDESQFKHFKVGICGLWLYFVMAIYIFSSSCCLCSYSQKHIVLSLESFIKYWWNNGDT